MFGSSGNNLTGFQYIFKFARKNFIIFFINWCGRCLVWAGRFIKFCGRIISSAAALQRLAEPAALLAKPNQIEGSFAILDWLLQLAGCCYQCWDKEIYFLFLPTGEY